MDNFKLSVNTGFAVNRIIDHDEFLRFVSQKLKINYIQPTSDWLNLFMTKKYLFKSMKKFNRGLSKHNVNVNSAFTGAFTRLNHLAHPDKEHQKFWINWFKSFIDISEDLGAKYVGSHLGILSYTENKNRKNILVNRVAKNWNILNNYSQKKKISLIWEPMSISREFGETISECRKIQKILNKDKKNKINLCLDVGHGDINSKKKENYDPYTWLNSFGKDSPVVHIKQVQQNNFSHLPFTKKNNYKGLVDPKKVIKILKNERSESTELAFELSFKERDPIDKNMRRDIIESVKYWKKFLN